MKVIFLDFWGVMDGPLEWSAAGRHRFDPRCGECVQGLCERTGAKVVITSDAVQWFPKEMGGYRTHAQLLAKAVNDLAESGVDATHIIGCTEQGPESVSLWDRPRQIRKWLVEHKNVVAWVVFDDMRLLLEEGDITEFKANILETWKTQEGGGTPQDWADRVSDPDPEMAARFVHINGNHALTDNDVARAEAILSA